MGGILGSRPAQRALCAAAAGAALLAAAARADEPAVRVLLYRGPGPVRVAAAGGTTQVSSAPEGLRADGRPVAGGVVRVEGPARFAGVRYRGRILVRPDPAGLAVVNEVPLERYVEGTLLREVYRDWAPAVLRAQAVAVRTYALYQLERRRGRPFDLTADTDHQVYGGMEAEAPEATRAVAATRGEYLAYRGRPILAAYHSSAGGRTASSQEVWGRRLPYLVIQPVAGEEASPDAYWRIGVSPVTLERALRGLGLELGPVREVRVLERSGSGRVARIALQGPQGAAEISGRALREALGFLPSTLFEVRRRDGEFVLVGSGRGHGVGMSQWGARAMAEGGADYREIVARFYPGTSLLQRSDGDGR